MDEFNAREILFSYVKEKYGTSPEYPFSNDFDSAVLRHEGEKGKWYALFMSVNGKKISPSLPDRTVQILNLKGDPLMIGALRQNPGYYSAYHMNKEHWFTVLLDGTVDEEEIFGLIDISFEMTEKGAKHKRGGKTDWLIPSNPKLYDIVKGFEESEIHDWSQSSNVKAGDTVYMYVGVPYRAIMFKCEVLKTDFERYWDERPGKKAMKLKLVKSYGKDFLNKDVLLAYGIKNVRGPRYMPRDLIEKIEAVTGELHN